MVGRTRKKNKKVEKKFQKRNKWWEKQYRKIGRNMLKSGTYKSNDGFMRKDRANAQLGELFTPIVVDYAREIEIPIVKSTFDVMDHTPHCQNFPPNNNPIDDIREAFGDRELRFPEVVELNRYFIQQLKKDWEFKEECAICTFPLTYDYPKDYPKEWMFCCNCFKWARKIAENKFNDDGYYSIMNTIKGSQILTKLLDRITLVKGNDKKR